MARQDDDLIGIMVAGIIIFSLVVGAIVLISQNQNPKTLSISRNPEQESNPFPMKIPIEQCYDIPSCTKSLYEREGMTISEFEAMGYRIYCGDNCWVNYYPIDE